MQIELHEIITAISAMSGNQPIPQNAATPTNEGPCIVILDKGFVYKGNVTILNDWVMIGDAVNIRVWGTTNGLGELALTGPTSSTRLDKCGDMKAPLRALIALLPCKTNW